MKSEQLKQLFNSGKGVKVCFTTGHMAASSIYYFRIPFKMKITRLTSSHHGGTVGTAAHDVSLVTFPNDVVTSRNQGTFRRLFDDYTAVISTSVTPSGGTAAAVSSSALYAMTDAAPAAGVLDWTYGANYATVTSWMAYGVIEEGAILKFNMGAHGATQYEVFIEGIIQ